MFKRVLMAVAVAAAVSAPAFAEVSISGEIDAYMDYVSHDGEGKIAQNIESTIFFSGEHKLDSGLTGTWLFGLTSEDAGNTGSYNAAAPWVHQSWVGIKGDFGHVRFGKMLSPAFQLIDWYVTHSGNDIGEAMFDYAGSPTDFNRATDQNGRDNGRRTNNQVRYDGTFGAVNLSAAVIMNENGFGNTGDVGFSGSAIVDLAPVKLYGNYETNTDRQVACDDALCVGGVARGGYSFGGLGISGELAGINLGAAWQNVSKEIDGQGKVDQDNWWVTAGYGFGKFYLSGFGGQAGSVGGDKSGKNLGGASWASTLGDTLSEYNQYGVRLNYSLSKNVTWRNRVTYTDPAADGAKSTTKVRTNLLYNF